MQAWKRTEKAVAEALGGVRRVRVSYSESVGDIVHPHYSIEVKYGKQVPKYCIVKKPTMLKCEDRNYKLMPSKFMNDTFHVYDYEECARDKFLADCFWQARQYSDKTPLVCMKPPRYHGFIIITESTC